MEPKNFEQGISNSEVQKLYATAPDTQSTRAKKPRPETSGRVYENGKSFPVFIRLFRRDATPRQC